MENNNIIYNKKSLMLMLLILRYLIYFFEIGIISHLQLRFLNKNYDTLIPRCFAHFLNIVTSLPLSINSLIGSSHI